jgi:hypothetical protein
MFMLMWLNFELEFLVLFCVEWIVHGQVAIISLKLSHLHW